MGKGKGNEGRGPVMPTGEKRQETEGEFRQFSSWGRVGETPTRASRLPVPRAALRAGVAVTLSRQQGHFRRRGPILRGCLLSAHYGYRTGSQGLGRGRSRSSPPVLKVQGGGGSLV